VSHKKAGFVAIIGRPNVGKSTLMNFLVGEKLAGVSSKPQTTRGTVHGILTREQGQAVYLDTPGFHKPKDSLGEWMVHEVEKSLEGADLVYWLVLPGEIKPIEEKILGLLKKVKVPVILVINQVDRYPKEKILTLLDYFSKAYDFVEMIPISAKTGLQVDILLDKTFEHLPEGERLFPEDQLSDQTERYLVGELIREKLYHLTHEEVPYGTAVLVEEFNEREDGIIEIHATFVVEKDSQKAIVIGKNGEMIKEMGTMARADLENFLQRKVFLKLWVKTLTNWKRDSKSLKQLGFQ